MRRASAEPRRRPRKAAALQWPDEHDGPSPGTRTKASISAAAKSRLSRMREYFARVRRHLPGVRARAAACTTTSSTIRTTSSTCSLESPQLHQGRGHGPGQDPARQRHHDQRGRFLAPPAAHDAAGVSPPGHRPIQPADRRGQREIRRALGGDARARRTGQRHRRGQRAHPRDRAAVDFRRRSRAPGAQLGANPFEVVAKESEPRSQVRVPLPLADASWWPS